MRRILKLSLMIISVTICLSAPASSFEGPLQVNNLFPMFLHADQPYLERAGMESYLSYSLSHSSTYTVQSSGHWDIFLDMEVTEISFRYKRVIKDLLEIDLDVPLLIIGGGFMDGFLDEYHSAFGFPDYGRSARPENDFLFEVRRDGDLIIKGRSGMRLGDIRLAVKKPLAASDRFGLSVRGDVELPVGDAEEGFGNGSMDAGLAILLDTRISESIITYANLGIAFPGDVRGYEKVDLKNFLYGGAGVEAYIAKGFSLLVQLQGQSKVYPETDLRAVDREAWLLVIGGRYKTGSRSFDLSLTEDINTSGAPDFMINLTYKHSL